MRRRSDEALGSTYWKLLSASTISNLGDGIGVIAYPWLASAVTRNPLLIALVVAAQRLPWLFFTLPAGVITDRSDRRALMIKANVARAVLTALVALAVASRSGSLPGPDVVADLAVAIPTDLFLYLTILAATILLGMAEVLYDNTAQTIMPSVVASDHLEKANGRLWSVEMVANSFVGPPLGALLIAVSFSLPFFVDAVSFAVSAALISLLPRITTADKPGTVREAAPPRPDMRADIGEGFRWLWSHNLLRPMAIILGFLNALGAVSLSILVLYGQEVLNTSATEFAILAMGGGIGGVIGGWTASRLHERIDAGPALGLTILTGGAVNIGIGLTTSWPFAFVLLAAYSMTGLWWNVLTVSLRQTIIPDDLLGRVNSVYRFFAWGMIPLGSLLGGLVVLLVDDFASRENALRAAWLAAGAGHIVLLIFATPKLTTTKIKAARAAA